MFRLVMNPKMKNSAVTVTNGIKYPGDGRAADCFPCVAIDGFSPLPRKKCFRLRRPVRTPQDDSRTRPVGCIQPVPVRPGIWLFAAHYTIRKTPGWGSDGDCPGSKVSHLSGNNKDVAKVGRPATGLSNRQEMPYSQGKVRR